MSATTRDLFIEEARRQFAEKGFSGTSIASIAEALGLTKQALLHHFGTKEKLYGEVLQALSGRMLNQIIAAAQDPADAGSQLEKAMTHLCAATLQDSENTQLITRELLDNRQRAETAGTWYLKPFLESLMAMAKGAPGHEKITDTEALAIVYQLLGAVNYFAISEVTLKNMFGKVSHEQLRQRFTDDFRSLVRAHLAVRQGEG